MVERSLQVPASTGTITSYLPVLSDHTVLGGYVVCNANAADAELTVTLKSGSTTIGVATIPDTTAVGVPVAITMNATLATRKTKVGASTPLTLVTGGQQTASIGFDCVLKLDEFAIPRD